MSKTKIKQKILIWDIETTPIKVWTFRLGKQDVGHSQIVDGELTKIITIGYKWHGSRDVYDITWKHGDSKRVIEEFKKIVESADLMVAHNGVGFDVKHVNALALHYKIPPIAWPNIEDTLLQSRNQFNFICHRLDYLAKVLVGSRKQRTDFQLWIDITQYNCKTSLKRMVRYCRNDVRILDKVYTEIKTYTPARTRFESQSAIGATFEQKYTCRRCEGETKKDGIRVTTTAKKQALRCKSSSCGHRFEVPYVSYQKDLEKDRDKY